MEKLVKIFTALMTLVLIGSMVNAQDKNDDTKDPKEMKIAKKIARQWKKDGWRPYGTYTLEEAAYKGRMAIKNGYKDNTAESYDDIDIDAAKRQADNAALNGFWVYYKPIMEGFTKEIILHHNKRPDDYINDINGFLSLIENKFYSEVNKDIEQLYILYKTDKKSGRMTVKVCYSLNMNKESTYTRLSTAAADVITNPSLKDAKAFSDAFNTMLNGVSQSDTDNFFEQLKKDHPELFQ
jgi:hypothetical protein